MYIFGWALWTAFSAYMSYKSGSDWWRVYAVGAGLAFAAGYELFTIKVKLKEINKKLVELKYVR